MKLAPRDKKKVPQDLQIIPPAREAFFPCLPYDPGRCRLSPEPVRQARAVRGLARLGRYRFQVVGLEIFAGHVQCPSLGS